MSQARIGEIERRMNGVQRDIADALSRIAALQQLLNKLANGLGLGGSAGGSTRLHWARVPVGGVDAATGTWPSLSPSSFTSDVYRGGGSLALVAEDATVYWYYLDGADEGSLVPCLPNGDGSYSAVTNSCTPIPEDA